MRAAVVHEYKSPIVIEEIPDPVGSDEGVILTVEACGVCRSDWHGWQGEWPGFTASLPHVFGHEFVGTVLEAGKNVQEFRVGDRVIVPFTVGCGKCEYCRRGESNVCENIAMPGFSYDGGFARLTHVPNADLNLVRLPDELAFADAAGMGCRFMTAYHGVTTIGNVRPGDWVSIYGAGGVGLSATQIASSAGANVIIVDITDDKLDLAKRLGAVRTVNSTKDDPVEAIQDITKGGADVSIDALGIAQTVTNSVRSVRRKGSAVQIGMTPEGRNGQVPLTINDVVSNEISYRGSFGMPAVEFPAMLNQVATSKLRPGDLVTKHIGLDGVNQSMNDMTTFNTLGVSIITDYEH